MASKKEKKVEEKKEVLDPILDPANDRLAFYPIKHKEVYDMYKKHESAIWHANEVKLVPDKKHWATLDKNTKYFLKMVLAFFAVSDGVVFANLILNFINEVQMYEAKLFYAFQAMMENIHAETYGNLIDVYVDDPEEKKRLLDAATNFVCVAKKTKWAQKWMDSKTNSFYTRLVAFAMVEGIFFSGSFCAIFWMKEKGKLPGLCTANSLISRDEGLHTDFACLVYNKYILKKNRIPQSRFEEIIKEAVAIEIEFLTEALPVSLLGMNKNMMTEYIKYVANRLTVQLKHEIVFEKVTNPFDFMDRIALPNKTNFFEEEVTEYQKNTSKDDNPTEDPYAAFD